MGHRSYVPFDVFSMRVAVPVSTLVRDGALGWTCGQCPLGHNGEVLSPGKLVAQAGHVCDMIEGVLQRGGFENRSVGKLNVYFVEAQAGEGEEAVKLIKRRFAHAPVIVPIPVPHFYYDGMMIEVDVFAGPHARSRSVLHNAGVSLQIVEGGDVTWVSVETSSREDMEAGELLAEISAALSNAGLDPHHLLSDHWFRSGFDNDASRFADTLRACDWVTNPKALVEVGNGPAPGLLGELTFSRDAVELSVETDSVTGLELYRRRSGAMLWISGVCADPNADLVQQTREIMSGIEKSLCAETMSFAKVTKLLAHYVGGASEEELHGNMTIRHSFYSDPGPASTGLPVSSLQDPSCRIGIDTMAVF